jgi:ABC-type Fe3+/spermidine/putrescine transport system ATPase subunit
VLANFGGINLTFIFIATLGSTGVLRYWLQDVGIKLTSIGFNLYTFSEDFERPKTAFVAQFVGISSRVSVVVTGHEVEAFGQRCPVRSGDSSAVTGAADALLRPEDIAIEVDPDGKGFVTRKSFLGAMTRLVVQIGEISVRVDVRSDVGSEIELGSHVRASIVARDVLVAPRKEVVVADEVAAQ